MKLTLIAQHMPFIFLVTMTICTMLYVIIHANKNLQLDAKRWLNRHPIYFIMMAVVIFVGVSLVVLTLATEIL
jgi:hypothetical protein